jgi:hypothetical protein
MSNEDLELMRDIRPGEALCLKKHPTGDEKPVFAGYSAFGIIRNAEEPVTIYLRGDSPVDDFKKTFEYPTFDDAVRDGWVVD